MKAWLPLQLAVRALRRNKVRATLTALGIVVGTAAVIAVVAVGQGASFMVRTQIESMGSNMLLVFPGSMKAGGARGGSGSEQSLTVADGEAIAQECPGILAVSPGIRGWVQIVSRNRNWRSSSSGVSPEYVTIRRWSMENGDFFTDADVTRGARVCVLGSTVVREVFEDVDPVGQMVRLNNMPFWVVGTMSTKGTAAFGYDQDDTILMPWTTMQRVIQGSASGKTDQLMVGVESAAALPLAKEAIETLLRQRHRTRSDADSDFTVMDLTEMSDTITQVSRLMTVMLTVIASISLLVGGVGIMNIMLVSVTERTREIGIRMAVGARPRDIMLQFLVEALVLSGLGAVLGAGLGGALASVLSNVNQWPVLVSPSAVIIAILFAGSIGVFFGFYPAWRASRLNPIECLRYE